MTMNDLISRQAAIDLMFHALEDDWELDYAEARMNELPSAEPERKKGKWVFDYGLSQCSECKTDFMREYNYCPNCGADMRESL